MRQPAIAKLIQKGVKGYPLISRQCMPVGYILGRLALISEAIQSGTPHYCKARTVSARGRRRRDRFKTSPNRQIVAMLGEVQSVQLLPSPDRPSAHLS